MASSNQNISMSVHDLSSDNPSICIPRTFANVTWQLVKDAFDEIFGIGYVERVDVINKTDNHDNEYKKIFIHFTKWPETDYAKGVKKALLDGKTIKVVYQYPWYWKCVMSNVPKRNWHGQKPYIEIEGHTAQEITMQGAKSRLFSQIPYDNRHVIAAQAIQDVNCNYPNNHQYQYHNCSPVNFGEDISLQDLEEGGASFSAPVPNNF